MSKIGSSIYLLRVEKKLSQKELAVRSGIPQPNLSAIEKGRDFKVSTLYKLAEALKVSPAELITGLRPIAVDKEKFFQRDNIEKFVNRLSKDHSGRVMNQLEKTLAVTLSGDSKRRDLHWSWIKLRRTFSRDELDSIFSRLRKAKERASFDA